MARIIMADKDPLLCEMSAVLFQIGGIDAEVVPVDERAFKAIDWTRIDALVVGLDPEVQQLARRLRWLGVEVPIVGLRRGLRAPEELDVEIVLERPVTFEAIWDAVYGLVGEGMTA